MLVAIVAGIALLFGTSGDGILAASLSDAKSEMTCGTRLTVVTSRHAATTTHC